MKTIAETLFNKTNKTSTEHPAINQEITNTNANSNPARRTFGTVDLWNIQRQRKTWLIR